MRKITLKAARVNAGYTQSGAAELLGVSTRTIWQWENGLSQPKPQMIDKICEAYSITYDELIFFSKENS